jgi:hypothetical protein
VGHAHRKYKHNVVLLAQNTQADYECKPFKVIRETFPQWFYSTTGGFLFYKEVLKSVSRLRR